MNKPLNFILFDSKWKINRINDKKKRKCGNFATDQSELFHLIYVVEFTNLSSI